MKKCNEVLQEQAVMGEELSKENVLPTAKKPKGSFQEAKRKEKIFLFFFLLYPIGQALFFYISINLNSILLAFQEYVPGEAIIRFTNNPFANFERVIREIFVTGELWTSMINSTILLVITTVIGMPIHIIVAYSIFRKIPGSGFYKVMLFLPNMISSMIFVIAFRSLIEGALPILLNQPRLNLLDKYVSSSFWTVTLFGFWLEFSGSLVIYLSAMAGIPVDVLEYGKLERMSSIKEMWYVVLPLMFSTITTYIVIGITKFFTYQGFFFSFFGAQLDPTPFDTLGYIFFARVIGSDAGIKNYPYASAAGLLFTLVIGPLTLGSKYLLEKYGPSEE